ncbi:MAG TPA: dienelactone hydrolase family protein, partial [Steroidobacteraceae bacterium]|nr:dienelactone hydrolase family protein [Steroidobacteraceae bacterium]
AFDHDGVELVGQMAVPEKPGPHPAVMVMHTALGLGEMMRERVRRLAQLGYVAVATDMYGGGVDYRTDPKSGGTAMMDLLKPPERLRARAAAWYEQLKARPEVDAQSVAAIGFCFGGQCVLELARSGADVKAVVSYHGLLSTSMPAVPGAVHGQVAVYTGAKDPYAPAEHVTALQEEMTAAGAHFHITVFSEACHAFTDPNARAMGLDGIAYDRIADRVSWAGTLALLEATISH